MSVISYPIPPYQNLPINADFYQPSRFVISGIALGNPTIVTTSVNHNYVIGQLIRLIIPQPYGCRQLNEQSGYIIAIPSSDQVTVTIDSTQSDPFISATNPQQPQILAIGDINTGVLNASGRNQNGTTIPGAFINISPL